MVVRSRERHVLAITPSKTTFYPTDVPYLGLEFQSFAKYPQSNITDLDACLPFRGFRRCIQRIEIGEEAKWTSVVTKAPFKSLVDALEALEKNSDDTVPD